MQLRLNKYIVAQIYYEQTYKHLAENPLGTREAIVYASMTEYAEQFKPKWVPVSERLPEQGEKVLCIQNPHTTATRNPLYAIFDGAAFMVERQTVYANYEVGKAVWSDITHWMPLPEPPTVNQNK